MHTDSKISIWHRHTGTLLEKFPAHRSGCVNAVAWNVAKPYMFASAGDDHCVRVWASKVGMGSARGAAERRRGGRITSDITSGERRSANRLSGGRTAGSEGMSRAHEFLMAGGGQSGYYSSSTRQDSHQPPGFDDDERAETEQEQSVYDQQMLEAEMREAVQAGSSGMGGPPAWGESGDAGGGGGGRAMSEGPAMGRR